METLNVVLTNKDKQYMDKQFTMSMFASEKDLYKAKCEQLQQSNKALREALDEIVEWPRNPNGPNYSIKYIAKQALED